MPTRKVIRGRMLNACLAACAVILIITASMGCTDDDEKNDTEGWKNLSQLQKDVKYDLPYKFRELSNTTNARNILDPSSTVLLVIGLDSAVSPVERDSLIEYVKEGGTLVFASDRADLAEPFTKAFRVRYYHHELIDKEYQHNYDFIISKTDFFGEEMEVMMNGAMGLNVSEGGGALEEPEPGAVDPADAVDDDSIERVLATSPVTLDGQSIDGFSYVDLNDNGEWDTWDLDGPVALGYRVKRDKGTAYIFGNSGLFLNQMLAKRDNAEFLSELLAASIPDDGTVYMDTTHHSADSSHHLHLPD